VSEKIAVHCPTRDLWDRVQIKLYGGIEYTYWECHGTNACVSLNKSGTSRRSSYRSWGYTIISAEDYLMEEDNVKFKVGDRVVGIDIEHGSYIPFCGVEGIITSASNITSIPLFTVEWDNGKKKEMYGKRFKLATSNQTKTTKEETMNINDNVLEVFENSKDAKKVAQRFGDQYGTTDRDTIALNNDKKKLLAIIEAEEKEEKKTVKIK